MRITAFIPLILIAIIGAGFAFGLRNDPRQLPSAMVDRPVPDFALPPIREMDAGFRRADLDGKVSMVNVFASWCISCRVEHPTLMRLAGEGRIPIYGVDWKDRPQDGAGWLDAFGDPYSLVGLDQDSKLAIDLGVTGAPETYIIDHTGRIRYKQIGPITEDVWRDTIEPIIIGLEEDAS